MDYASIALFGGGAAAAGLACGIGLQVGARLLPLSLTAYRDLKSYQSDDESRLNPELSATETQRRQLSRPRGAQRETSITGIHRDSLRHRDGSYTRGYTLTPQPTMLERESVAEARVDAIARMLTSQNLPAGTVLQFRYAVGPDPGRAIAEHLRSRDYLHSHLPAARLHDMKVDFYANQ